MPRVSVVIPTRDRRDMLARTLGTVLAQTAADLEVIVVDDGSTDGTADLLRRQRDERLRTIRHERSCGVARSRNDGIARARGEWIALLDDDDLWAPAKLADQLAAAAAAGAPWACSGAVAVDHSLRVVDTYRPASPEELRRSLAVRNPVPAGASNVLVARAALAEAGLFREDLRHLADWDLWRRLAAIAAPAVVPRPHVAYLIHPGNASRDTPGIVEEARLVEATGQHPIDWSVIHAWIARNHLRAGRRGQAAAAYLRAARAGGRGHTLRALNALLLPGAASRTTFHPFRRDAQVPDTAWAAAADRWLAALR